MNKTTENAWRVYNEAVTAAEKAYDKAVAKTRVPAWRAYTKAVETARAAYKAALEKAEIDSGENDG
jgi:hypothetical protein